MPYLIFLFVLIFLQGCSGWKGIAPRSSSSQSASQLDQTRFNAVRLCKSAGFTPNTEAYSNCVMSEMQRQMNAANYNQQQRKARVGRAIGVWQHNMNRSFDNQQRIYQNHKDSINQPPAIKQPTITNCYEAGNGISCTTY